MKVKVHLLSQSQAMEISNVTNAYTKDSLYCLYFKDTNTVSKYPLCNIYKIEEQYND